MERKKFCKTWQILFASFIALIAGSCDDPGELGLELLPATDLISVNSIIDRNISAYTLTEDSLRTDETTRSLIGSIADPVFGKTTIDLACQFRLSYFPEIADDAVADSIFLYLYYKYFYGDTLTPQKLKVFELNESLDIDEKYYQDEDLSSYAKNTLLGELEFIPRQTVVLDSTYGTLDTMYQVLKIPLDISLAEKLMTADSTDMVNNEAFLEYFKGLYVGVEEVENNGTILALELVANSYTNGSALLIHFHHTDPESGEQDTTNVAYLPSKFSARVNSYRHEYENSSINDIINNEQPSNGHIYIQSTGGLKSKLSIPGLDTWKDSVNIAINKAEVIFHIDSVASQPETYIPPNQLLLTIIDEDGKEYLPKDYSFNSTFYGGRLDTTDYTYRFNIAQHLQEIVEGNFTNNGFYLSASKKNQEYSRVILNGAEEENGIELIIAYSKILQ